MATSEVDVKMSTLSDACPKQVAIVVAEAGTGDENNVEDRGAASISVSSAGSVGREEGGIKVLNDPMSRKKNGADDGGSECCLDAPRQRALSFRSGAADTFLTATGGRGSRRSRHRILARRNTTPLPLKGRKAMRRAQAPQTPPSALCHSCSKLPRDRLRPEARVVIARTMTPRSVPYVKRTGGGRRRTAGMSASESPPPTPTWRELTDPQFSPSARKDVVLKRGRERGGVPKKAGDRVAPDGKATSRRKIETRRNGCAGREVDLHVSFISTDEGEGESTYTAKVGSAECSAGNKGDSKEAKETKVDQRQTSLNSKVKEVDDKDNDISLEDKMDTAGGKATPWGESSVEVTDGNDVCLEEPASKCGVSFGEAYEKDIGVGDYVDGCASQQQQTGLPRKSISVDEAVARLSYEGGKTNSANHGHSGLFSRGNPANGALTSFLETPSPHSKRKRACELDDSGIQGPIATVLLVPAPSEGCHFPGSAFGSTSKAFLTPQKARNNVSKEPSLETNKDERCTSLLDQALADIEVTASIPHLELTVIQLEGRVDNLAEEILRKNSQIKELLHIAADQEKRLHQERNLRLEAEKREGAAFSLAASQARSTALEYVRQAMSPTGSNRRESVHCDEVTRLNDSLHRVRADLETERSKRHDEVRALREQCKEEAKKTREARDTLFNAHEKQLELHKEVKKFKNEISRRQQDSNSENLAAQDFHKLRTIRADFEVLKNSTQRELTKAKESIEQAHSSLLSYVVEEIETSFFQEQENAVRAIETSRKELEDAQTEISELKKERESLSVRIAEGRTCHNADVFTYTPKEPTPGVMKASPVPNLQSWHEFTGRFRQVLSGELQLSGIQQQLDDFGMDKAERLFKELCFSTSVSPMSKKCHPGCLSLNVEAAEEEGILFFDAICQENKDFIATGDTIVKKEHP